MFIKTRDHNGNDLVAYYQHNHLQAPLQAIDKQGNIRWAAQYAAFGQTRIISSGDSAINSNLRLPGQYADSESGLYYNWQRYYDANTGRYISSDPIGLEGGLNTYGYVEGNPLMYTDPTGENPIGMALGFGIELGMQLAMNGGNWDCVDWADVAVSTLVGAIAPGALSTGKTVLKSGKAAKNLSKQLSRARTANRRNKINSRVNAHKNAIRDAVITQAAWQGVKQVGKKTGNCQSDNCGFEK